MQQVLK